MYKKRKHLARGNYGGDVNYRGSIFSQDQFWIKIVENTHEITRLLKRGPVKNCPKNSPYNYPVRGRRYLCFAINLNWDVFTWWVRESQGCCDAKDMIQMNVFIYKGQLGNKDFENKKLTLLVALSKNLVNTSLVD